MTEPTELEVSDWLRRMRDGDAQALTLLFEYAYHSLEKLAGPVLGRDPTVAAYAEYGDLFHDALLKLLRKYQNPAAVPHDGGLIRLEVCAALKNVRIDMNRKLNGPNGLARNHTASIDEKKVVAVNHGPGPYTAAMNQDRIEQVQAAIQTLPEALRNVVTLYFVEGKTRPEAAAILGLNLNKYNFLLAKGLALLKPILAHFEGTR